MAPLARPEMLSRLRATLALGAALAGLLAAVALGNWQVRRAAEHSATETAWEAARRADPLGIRTTADLVRVAEHLPRRVRVAGEFEYERTVWLDNRALEGRAGFLVVTPLRLPQVAERILVMRGWAPRDPLDRSRLPVTGRAAGLIEIEGMALAGVPRLFEFAGGPAEAGPIRQNLDLDAMRAELGAPLAPFVIQQTSPLADSLQRRVVAPASGADRNRAYAVQWFALAGLCGIFAAGLCWRLYRRGTSARISA